MNRRDTVPATELSHLPLQGSHVELLSGEDEHHKDRPSAPYPKISGFLRQFRLGFLAIAFGSCLNWRSNTEYRKVAMYHSRTIAATHSLLHLVPLSGAVTLLVLQLTSYFVSLGDVDSTMLQFVAKLHELFMQASIIEIMFCLVRTQVINGFVPLGLLSGVVQATQLSYIWSLDYLSIYRSFGFRGWQKVFFAITFPFLVLLISLVGPSSAVLMIPRPGSPHARNGFTLYAYNSTEELFPTMIGHANGLSLDVTRMNLTINNAPLDKQTDVINGKNYTCVSYLNQDSSALTNTSDETTAINIYDRTLRISSASFTALRTYPEDMSQQFSSSWDINQVLVNVPSLYDAASFQNVNNDSHYDLTTESIQPFLTNGTVTAGMSYPLVDVRCGSWSEPVPNIPYLDDAGTFDAIPSIDSIVTKASESFEDDETTRYYAPVWIRSPQPGSTSLVGIFIKGNTTTPLMLPSMLVEADQTWAKLNIFLTTCTLSAFWEYGEVQLHESPSEQVVKTVLYPTSKSNHARPISLTVTDVQTNQSARFHQQMQTLDAHLIDLQDAYWYTVVLSTTFALAISRIPEVILQEDYTTAQRSGYRLKHLHWYPSSAYPVNTTIFKFGLTVYGYGYGTRSTSVNLAMAVIFTYCIITILYIIYTIITGSSSTAWNSGIELVTLALQSKKPDHLGHTSVGIDSIKTFGESVAIRVNADDELELVFAHDRDFEKRGLRKIERNKEY
ncbi:hypothetical protein HBI65_214070 [Parastagonospora nodorum]|nr:hypothetical protein HBI16_242200 [Parastagonospora nodorum]KAH6081271.1 hypothetical protein HBI65_214070 [Parastagonospora nodorum]